MMVDQLQHGVARRCTRRNEKSKLERDPLPASQCSNEQQRVCFCRVYMEFVDQRQCNQSLKWLCVKVRGW